MKYYNVYVQDIGIFTYKDEDDEFEIGENVIVPFRATKKSAFIIEELDENSLQKINFEVLPISSKIENSIIISKNQLQLIKWISDYYLCEYKHAFNSVIPKNILTKVNFCYIINFDNINKIKIKDYKYILDLTIEKSTLTVSYFKHKFSKNLYTELLDKQFIKLSKDKKTISLNLKKFKSLEKFNKNVYDFFYKKIRLSSSSIKNPTLLRENGIINVIHDYQIKEEKNEIIEDFSFKKILLSKNQKNITKEIINSDEKYFLIKGVTGSGKTEIYIEIIKSVVKEGGGIIFLVPEISLTPQMINRFKLEFKNNVAIIHSALSEKERKDEWLSIYSGKKKIVLGVRSAIFAPVKNLKYIIIDEEHDDNYKQNGSSPRYNAKYVAIKRSMIENVKLVLGSATPSIESYFYAKNNIYNLLTLNERFGNASIPNTEIVDMRKEEHNFFSERLLSSIKDALLKNEQVILLLNRKGYSTYIQCKDCGYVEECENCSIKMTYYIKSNKLKCNYCGKTKKFTNKCTKCNSENLFFGGKGLEKIEEELKKYFDVPMISIDADKSKKKDFFNLVYSKFSNGEYKILIGTQIIAKGLHFPNVTLVGVIDADASLNFPDFRSNERTFQLLTQVSGRSGRGDREGKVIIQTYQPENYTITNSKEELFTDFYNKEIEYRKILNYPPYSKIINIGISSQEENTARKIAQKLFQEIKNVMKDENIYIYGPMPSLVYKVKMRYRYNIFIKGNKKTIDKFKEKIKNIEDFKYKSYHYRITIDVDPINLI